MSIERLATNGAQGMTAPMAGHLGDRAIVRVGHLRIDLILAAILLVALAARLQLATSRTYIHDEESTAIPLSKTISFAPGRVHLPLRGENHGALPAYVVKASGAVFGTTRLGYRMLHLLASLITVVLVYAIAREWYGPPAARWASALLAFNEYYLSVSARATAQVPYLLLMAVAVYAFSRFMASPRAVFLYITGGAVGLAFYCKEHSVLLLPVLFVMLLQRRYRHWFRSAHTFAAVALCVLVLAPDFVWNAQTDTETARATYGERPVLYANYASHLRRVGGLGFSPYPSMFYARTGVRALYQRVTGTALFDDTEEYPSINLLLGIILVGSVVLTTIRRSGDDGGRLYLLLLFWGVFIFFTLIKKGDPPGRLAPVNWMWVEMTMVPAAVLTGARLAESKRAWRVASWATAAIALLVAVGALIQAQH